MALFKNNKKSKEIKINTLREFIYGMLESGKDEEYIRGKIKEVEEFAGYTKEEIDSCFIDKNIKNDKKESNFFVKNKDGFDIEKEIKKLPRNMRKKAKKLYKEYKEGKVLIPERNKKIFNK